MPTRNQERKCIVQIVRAPAGGIRKHILEIIKGCPQFDFILITNRGDGDSKFKEFELNPPKNLISIIHCKIVDRPGFSDFWNFLFIRNKLKEFKVDLIHGHGAKGGLYTRLLGITTKAKIFYTAHGGSIHSMHGSFKNLLYQIIEKLLYFLTDKVVFESQYSMSEYKRKIHSTSSKFELNYNCVEVPKGFESLEPKEISKDFPIIIGSFALLRYIKGHDILIKAIAIARKKIPSIELRIYGDGVEKEKLEDLIRKLKLEDCVQIFPFENQINQAMRQCHIIAHPSRFESFGYVPLEATTNGVPVVSSLAGGLKEVIDNGRAGFAVSPLIPENFAQSIIEVIENKSLRKERFMNAKQLIHEKFSKQRFLQVISQLYEQ